METNGCTENTWKSSTFSTLLPLAWCVFLCMSANLFIFPWQHITRCTWSYVLTVVMFKWHQLLFPLQLIGLKVLQIARRRHRTFTFLFALGHQSQNTTFTYQPAVIESLGKSYPFRPTPPDLSGLAPHFRFSILIRALNWQQQTIITKPTIITTMKSIMRITNSSSHLSCRPVLLYIFV